MSTLKKVFPSWVNMWQSYSKNYMETYYVKTLGQKAVHILVLHSVYNYWRNDDFESDEESSIDKLMIMIRAKAISLSQNLLLYQSIYEKLRLPNKDYQLLKEEERANLGGYYRKDTVNPNEVFKANDIQYQGMQYPSNSVEKTLRNKHTNISEGRNTINQTTFSKHFPIEKNWIARLINSFSEARLNLESIVASFSSVFCSIYPLEGNYTYDEASQEYRWKSKRQLTEELEIEEEAKKAKDDESIKDLEEAEYNQIKKNGKEVQPTWYLESTYRFLERLKKEAKKLSAMSKQKQEQRIEATEKLIKIYEKTYESPDIDFFFNKLNEIEGYEDYKNIVGNYFVNLLNPTNVPFRPLSFILAGPPGTGKSAIAAKTAESAKRAFIRIPMNGQAEPTYLKGREIAYGGADQGKILKEILTKGSCQPVVLIDELTRAGSKALTDIIGTMTDPDQNAFAFEDDWLKWRIDLSRCVFIIADNHIEKIDPFLLSRSQIVNIPILSYQKRVDLVLKKLKNILDSEKETKKYVEQINKDFCKYIITEEWGLRQTLANINNLFLSLRANVLMKNSIDNIIEIKEVEKTDSSYALNYQNGQRIILIRVRDEQKDLDGTVHSVLTDIPDWPGAKPHDEEELRKNITYLDLSDQDLYRFDFTRYPKLKILLLQNNRFKDSKDEIFDHSDKENIVLTKNTKLEFLDISNNNKLSVSKIEFGDAKKSLEKFYFVNTKEKTIDLQEFSNLKEISYDYQVDQIYLSKELSKKIKRIYQSWKELDEDQQTEFIQKHPDSIYEKAMSDKVTYLEMHQEFKH